ALAMASTPRPVRTFARTVCPRTLASASYAIADPILRVMPSFLVKTPQPGVMLPRMGRPGQFGKIDRGIGATTRSTLTFLNAKASVVPGRAPVHRPGTCRRLLQADVLEVGALRSKEPQGGEIMRGEPARRYLRARFGVHQNSEDC